MNINQAESSLAKFHLLHFVIGVVLGIVLLLVPKIVAVAIAVLVIALLLPASILPEFADKWVARAVTAAGAIAVAIVFHFLHKL